MAKKQVEPWYTASVQLQKNISLNEQTIKCHKISISIKFSVLESKVRKFEINIYTLSQNSKSCTGTAGTAGTAGAAGSGAAGAGTAPLGLTGHLVLQSNQFCSQDLSHHCKKPEEHRRTLGFWHTIQTRPLQHRLPWP